MIYLDNGATSYPKPVSVLNRAIDALKYNSFNSGRGGYKSAFTAAEKIYDVRKQTSEMFGFPEENVIFTKNCTEALNIAIRGSVKKGEHIIISSLEHNSVFRVVHSLFINDIADYDIAQFSFDPEQTVKNFERLIRCNTSVIVCMHSSNVFGVSFPIKEIGALCRKRGIRFIVDAAQGAGIADINGERDNIDILCAPGHKCLLGPMGSGFMAFASGTKITPLNQGGTGSESKNPLMPEASPERFEAGTLNNPAIIGMGEGISFIKKIGIDNIYNHELMLCSIIYDELSKTDGVSLYAPKPEKDLSMPIIAFNLKDYSSEKTAALLAEKDICTRAGFHCAPLAHRHFKTYNRGCVRISPGYFNTERECYRFMNVVKKL